MTFKQRVAQLSQETVDQIYTQYHSAMETEHGSGEHWILIATLNQNGFPVRSVTDAMDTAERILTLWPTLQK